MRVKRAVPALKPMIFPDGSQTSCVTRDIYFITLIRDRHGVSHPRDVS